MSLDRRILDVLAPNNSMSVIIDKRLHNLKPIISVPFLIDSLKDTTEELQKKILKELQQPGVLIYQNTVFISKANINFQDRISRIFTLYNEELTKVIGEKKDLIELYSQVSPSDIVHLIQHNIVFVTRKKLGSNQRVLCAVKYIPEFGMEVGKKKWRFPAVMLGLTVDKNLAIGRPEVIYPGGKYEHMFVFNETRSLGQRICMGSFDRNTKDKMRYQKLGFASRLTFWMAQAEQILTSGYNTGFHVNPVYHLDSERFEKYRVRKRR